MLAYFLAKLHRVDPDIIVGHNMGSFALEVLQHRMAACKVPQWSRIGRLRRKELPKVHHNNNNNIITNLHSKYMYARSCYTNAN